MEQKFIAMLLDIHTAEEVLPLDGATPTILAWAMSAEEESTDVVEEEEEVDDLNDEIDEEEVDDEEEEADDEEEIDEEFAEDDEEKIDAASDEQA